MDYLLISLLLMGALLLIGKHLKRLFSNPAPACCDQDETVCRGCTAVETQPSAAKSKWSKGKWQVVCTGSLALLSWIGEWSFGHHSLLAPILGISAVAIGGYPLARNAYQGLKKGKFNVDTLVIIAAGAALGLGEFLEAATVIFILLLGETLEAYSVAKAKVAIRGLGQLLPSLVRIRQDKEGEQQIPLEQVQAGMIIIVKPGERIAVDGRVVAGNSLLDQSPITGEAMPVNKGPGDEVYSGSLNLDGALQIEATLVGAQTTVARIKHLVEEAKQEKAPIQRLVDRYANWFVPIALASSLLVFLFTQDTRRAITLLIVACPCAFVLGTPIAVVAAIGSAAKKGILIKGGAILENISRLNSLVFDKTGTLTYGRPEVIQVKTFCSLECAGEDTLTFAAIAEKLSEHPLADAILEKAKEWELVISSPDEFLVKRGQGIVAKHEDINIILGNRSLLEDNQVFLPQDVKQYMKERQGEGETTLLVAHHKQVCGVISLADTLRANAHITIQQLKKLGIDRTLALYTGDNYEIARIVAQKLGMDEFAANLMPEQKVDKVKELIKRGYQVGMVGDGINDAPALATAQVGIAMGAIGSELAVSAADIALLTDDLSKIPLIIRLGRHTFTIIKENLWFALIFNGLMFYLASAGFLSMIEGALFHQLSSLGVILNSMRLAYPQTATGQESKG